MGAIINQEHIRILLSMYSIDSMVRPIVLTFVSFLFPYLVLIISNMIISAVLEDL